MLPLRYWIYCFQEEVLKQVQETALYRHVTEFLLSERSCCTNISKEAREDNLPDIAARVCCQGAGLLSGLDSSGSCCQETCVKCFKVNGDKPVTVVSGTVVNSRGEQGVDMLVPLSHTELGCCGCTPSNRIGMYPASNDVLTVLLLALPPNTWSGVKEEKLLQEIRSLVSTESLPILLQEEVCLTSVSDAFLLLVILIYMYLVLDYVVSCSCTCKHVSTSLKNLFVG